MLPFTTEVFFSVFERYNLAIWPAQVVAYVLGVGAVALTLRPIRGGDRLIAAALAAAWAWMGVVYHIGYFATVNFAAPAFGVFFVAQAVLLAWTGLIRGKLAFRFRADPAGWTGLALVVFAMAIYPLLGWLAGHAWPSAPMFGVAPCPTTIFTMGMLLLLAGRIPLHLVLIPVLWALVGGSAAWLLDVPEDLALPLAAAITLPLILHRNRHPRPWTPTIR